MIPRALSSLKDQVQALSAEVSAKLAERAALADDLAQVLNAPPAKSDILQMVEAWIEESAELYRAGLAIQLEPFMRRPNRKADRTTAALELLHTTLKRDPTHGLQVTASPEGLFCLLREPLTAALVRAIDDLPFDDFALDAETRERRAAELTEKLTALDKQLDELADFGAAAGVNLPRRELTAAEKDALKAAATLARAKAEKERAAEKEAAARAGIDAPKLPGDEAFRR